MMFGTQATGELRPGVRADGCLRLRRLTARLSSEPPARTCISAPSRLQYAYGSDAPAAGHRGYPPWGQTPRPAVACAGPARRSAQRDGLVVDERDRRDRRAAPRLSAPDSVDQPEQ